MPREKTLREVSNERNRERNKGHRAPSAFEDSTYARYQLMSKENERRKGGANTIVSVAVDDTMIEKISEKNNGVRRQRR